MSRKYVYFDSNIFQNIKNRTHYTNPEFWEQFNELFEKLKKKYIFPLSHAHIRDLSLHPTEKNLEDISVLYKMADGYGLSGNDPNVLILGRVSEQEIIELYQDEISCQDNIFPTQKGSNIREIKDILRKNRAENAIKELIPFLFENISNPKIYKEFRVLIQSVKKRFSNDSAIKRQSLLFKNIKPLLDFLISNDINKSEFLSALNVILAMTGKSLDTIDLYKKIEIGYCFLDFHQKTRDNITKNNTVNNILVDASHLCLAREAKYYVTFDKSHHKKAKMLFEFLNIRTQVLLPEEFKNKFC